VIPSEILQQLQTGCLGTRCYHLQSEEAPSVIIVQKHGLREHSQTREPP